MTTGATIIHIFAHPALHQRYLSAIAAGHHYAAWRLPCGREVLHLHGRLCVWHPNPRDGIDVVEVPMGAEESPADVVRRLDAIQSVATRKP